MHIQRHPRRRPRHPHHLRPETDVADEMPVHHIEMKLVRARRFGARDFLPKPAEIGGEQRRQIWMRDVIPGCPQAH
jgi:hypothetical protein